MPFDWKGTLAGVAGGWDDPSIAARHLFKKKEDKYRQELEDESFGKRLTTAYGQQRLEEGDTIDDIASAMVSGGEVDPVTNRPISQGAAYRRAKQTVGEAKAAEPLESAYKARLTTAMMPEAAETGKAESKAGIAERLKRASTALLGSEEAESERGKLVGERAESISEGYRRGKTGYALQRKTDEQRMIQGAPEATARREVLTDENEADRQFENRFNQLPRLTSATEAARQEEAGEIAKQNMTLGRPGAEARAGVAQADAMEQEARQRRITSKLEMPEASKLREANAKYEQIKADSQTELLARPLLARKFITASRMDPNNISKFLSDEELEMYKYLKDTQALDLFISQNIGLFRAAPYDALSAGGLGNPYAEPAIDPSLLSEFNK